MNTLKETQKVVEKKIALVLKFKIFFRTLLAICIVSAIFYSYKSNTKKCDYQLIEVNKITLCTRVAYSDAERISGLSGVSSLDKYEALLFVFEDEDKHGIWMKNMLIPIDIFWLNANKQVIHIEENVNPDTYPKVYQPKTNAKYVIETNAGFAEKNKLNLIDQFKW